MMLKEKYKATKRKIIALFMTVMLVSGVTGCASWDRAATDFRSEFSGGLQRTVRVYTPTGDLIAEYEGKIDLEVNENGKVKFDFDGKRYIYYNCLVESIAELE